MQIQTNVKLPQSKTAIAHARRRAAIFKAYADAYQAVYVKRPTGWTRADGELMRVHIDANESIVGSERRIKQLTNMLRSRLRG